MGTEEYLLDKYKKEGIEIGVETSEIIGEVKKSHAVVENLIIELGLQDDQAAKIAEVSVDFVRKVCQEIASRK